ncbi:MAG: acetate--CoA ligase [Legionellaceae bacterium]|nr:acetate--CoA ligase [Legionellaceae bacterium]
MTNQKHRTKTYPVFKDFADSAFIKAEQYESMYQQSINEPDVFWAEQAKQFIDFSKPWDRVFSDDLTHAKWFEGAELNVCYNCLDRHLKSHANRTAIIWEGDDPKDSRKITYQELYNDVCKFANVLKKLGVNKGDRVGIYMPMIPESVVAMLACARIGAVHSVVFGGFSSKALEDRLIDADCRVLITADESIRNGKHIPIKENADKAVNNAHQVKTVIVVKRTGQSTAWHDERDHWYHELLADADNDCPPTPMQAEDPLFILYTSGSTGKPKGVLHTSAGYLLYAAMTHKYVFDYHEDDIFWCTADIGWITGHSYLVYGPLANGATNVMFEGVPTYPTPARCWEIIDKHQVTIFYTAPTAIRALMREGDEFVQNTSRESLRLLGSVGEPINPEAWEWYFHLIGNEKCPIVDTWWQTETGGIMLTALPGAMPLKPGSAAKPFFGIQPAIFDNKGKALAKDEPGKLVIKHTWPGQARTLYNNQKRFVETYFNEFPNVYYTGDGAYIDQDGYYWISGRIDDVINISGHRIGTAEVESALVLHPAVTEAAVIGIPDEIKGNKLYAFVTLKSSNKPDGKLKDELIDLVAKEIGPIAKPDTIQFADDLPKTRSGKIMRRILRKIATGETKELGDTSTLANPEVVDTLLKAKNEMGK